MYGNLFWTKHPTEGLTADQVAYHRGTHRDFLRRCEVVIKTTLEEEGRAGLKKIAPYLFGWVADSRTIRCAWDHLSRKGGQAPGPNGHRYSDLTDQEIWSLCRCLAKAVRDGTYRPGKEYVRWISKGPGRGKRPLVIQNIEDRLVQRAVTSIIDPVLEHLFDEHSLGFRRGKDRLHALALAERYAREQQRWVWTTEDVRDAFLNVPLSRLLHIVRKYFLNEDLIGLIERILGGAKTPGLRQGGCLSPTLLNLALHAGLDRPWRKRHPSIPLIRVADDLLVLCRTEQEAKEAHTTLTSLLSSAGFAVKIGSAKATRNLEAGQRADWLGFHVGRKEQELAVGIAQKAWDRLQEKLAHAHEGSNAPLRAEAIIKGWIDQVGPCYPEIDLNKACKRIATLAAKQAFDEIPAPNQLKEIWQKAWARWGKVRNSNSVSPEPMP